MSIDVEELLRETPAPPMSLSPASVLGAAKQDVVRRRRRFAGRATAGVAAAAAVAITVGVVGREESTSRPIPANTPTQTNTPDLKDPGKAAFFGPSAGLPLGQIASGPIPVASDPAGDARTPITKYVVTRVDGTLRLSRLDGTTQTLLPLVEKLPDGGSVTTDRKQTLTVHPLPANVRSAEQIITSQAIVGGGGTTMPDGSKVGVFWTGDPAPASQIGVVWWYTTIENQIGASSGEKAKMVGMQIRSATSYYWEFTKAGICGSMGTFGVSRSLMDHGQCPWGVSASGDQTEWMQTVDGPISNLRSVPAQGVTDQTLVTANIPGTSRVVLWGVGTSSSGNGDPPFSKVTWTGSDGKAHSWDASTP